MMTNQVTKRASMIGLIALAGGLGGCVSQQAYDDAVRENRALKSRNVELQADVDNLDATVNRLHGQLGEVPGRMQGLEDTNARAQDQLRQALNTISELEAQLDGLQFGQLDPVTDDALRRMAARYPDLVRYDASRGMLQFASDLTFASGSADVQAQAKNSLAALANILKSGEATVYDVRIVGHTDSQKISARTRERHPSNMHLSAHRAISVRRELVSLGVPANRLMAAGWGEHRPVVANTATGNTPANRRVEIYLVPGSANTGTAGTGSVDIPGINADIDRDGIGSNSFEPTK